MSAISDLRKEVSDLEARVSVLESILLGLLEKGNVKDFPSELRNIGDIRQPIGYKTKS